MVRATRGSLVPTPVQYTQYSRTTVSNNPRRFHRPSSDCGADQPCVWALAQTHEHSRTNIITALNMLIFWRCSGLTGRLAIERDGAVLAPLRPVLAPLLSARLGHHSATSAF
jgi:hypothetical protein